MNATIWGKGKSARALAEYLELPRNSRSPKDILIRWKTMDTPSWKPRKELNSLSAIRLSSHKFESLIALKEGGLQIPPVHRDLNVLYERVGRDKIILARYFYHTQGNDIVIIKQLDRRHEQCYNKTGNIVSCALANEKDYYIQWLPSKAEYRYHVAFGHVILPTKKKLNSEWINEETIFSTLIRNHQNGKWLQVECDLTPKFADACIKAISILGLDFGAVDFLNCNGNPVILEVNTAPGLQIDNRLEAYGKAFQKEFARLRG